LSQNGFVCLWRAGLFCYNFDMIKEYINYLKDNPEGYWFKRKIFGWGWTPASWQGWVVITIFALALLWVGLGVAGISEPTRNDLIDFFTRVVVLLVLVILISKKKGQKPHWKWGFTPEEWEKYRDKS
jgi:hypothetical protein